MIQTVDQVKGRKGKRFKGRNRASFDAEVAKHGENLLQPLKRKARDHPVCAGSGDRVLFAEPRVNTAEEDRSPWMNLPSRGDRLGHPGIPIGHQGCDENRCGMLDLFEGLHKELFRNPVSAIRSWNMLEGRGSVRFFSEELPRPINTAGRHGLGFPCGMMGRQAVDEMDVESGSPEIPCQVKKAQRL